MADDDPVEPGTRRVSVLLQVPATPTLKRASRRPSDDRSIAMREALEPTDRMARIDPEFDAMPVGRGDQDFIDRELASFEATKHIVVKADIDVDKEGNIPEFIGEDVQVFSNPKIENVSRCMKSPPIGDIDDVIDLLDIRYINEKNFNGNGTAVIIVDSGVNVGYLEQAFERHVNFDGANSWSPQGSRICLLYTSPSPRDQRGSRMPSSA